MLLYEQKIESLYITNYQQNSPQKTSNRELNYQKQVSKLILLSSVQFICTIKISVNLKIVFDNNLSYRLLSNNYDHFNILV